MFYVVMLVLDVPPVFPPPSQLFSVLLQITNNAGCQVTLVSNDAKPLNGEILLPNSMLTVSKLTTYMKPIKFYAVDSATEKRLLINGQDSVNVSPSTKQILMPLIVSGKYSALWEGKVGGLKKLPLLIRLAKLSSSVNVLA